MLRDRSRHDALSDRLRAFVDVEGDPTIGSLLLRYDPADIAMEARIRAEVDTVWLAMQPSAEVNRNEGRADPVSPPSDVVARRLPSRVHTRARINRAAKVGALAGLTASLAALGVSRKLHAQIGVFAAAMILTHVAMHWRRALR
jgi:hypothetical protein